MIAVDGHCPRCRAWGAGFLLSGCWLCDGTARVEPDRSAAYQLGADAETVRVAFLRWVCERGFDKTLGGVASDELGIEIWKDIRGGRAAQRFEPAQWLLDRARLQERLATFLRPDESEAA